jgi:hypothetical protein
MKLVIKDLQLKARHQQLPFYLKFRYFFTMKKRRFFYMFLAYMYYKYHERVGNYFAKKRAQTKNKYKRRWINRFNPEAITYQTALDAAYYKP